MAKRLLILCDGFGPPSYGPRMTQVCKHLSKWGWQITMLTEKVDETYEVAHCDFRSMDYYIGGEVRKKVRWAMDKAWGYREQLFYRFVRKAIRYEDFDAILCSTFNDFPLQTAKRIAKESELPLVVDLRDISEQWGTNEDFRQHRLKGGKIGKWATMCYEKRIKRERNKCLEIAKAVTTISPWHCQVLKQYNEHTHLIYNGYDEEAFYPRKEKSEKFIVSYLGRIYNLGFRDPEAILQAVGKLLKEGKIANEDFELVFHIEKGVVTALQEKVADIGIETICRIGAYIPQKEAQELFRKSAISVVLVEEEKEGGSHGIMTTKFFEALGAEKPIICSPAASGSLADTIRYTQSGIASNNVEEIADFIALHYAQWKEKGYTEQQIAHKEEFARAYQAKQFEKILLQSIANEGK